MKKFSDIMSELEKKNRHNGECPTYCLNVIGPFVERTRNEIPCEKGIYFAFECEKESIESGVILYKRMVYVGKASEGNTLRKRIGDHYTQHDLKYRENGESVDMESIAFFCCLMDNDATIYDVEAAQIYAQNPPANTDGVDHYIGKTAPIFITIKNKCEFVPKNLYKDPVIIRKEDI